MDPRTRGDPGSHREFLQHSIGMESNFWSGWVSVSHTVDKLCHSLGTQVAPVGVSDRARGSQ